MIHGVGTDVIEIERVARVYGRHGQRFVERILTLREQEEFNQRERKANYLAKQFAAKEAVAKAFGTGIGKLHFAHIEVLRSEHGKPVVTLLDSAPNEFKTGRVHLSLSDTSTLVTAFAVHELV